MERVGSQWVAKLAGHAGTGVNFVARDPYTGRLWALLGHGHWGAKLSVSDDGGATWADNAAQIRYPERLLLAVSTAGVIESADGGRTWRSRNKGMRKDHSPEPEAEWGHDTHYIEQCQHQPQHIWQQNHAGVYYSNDGAESWQKVSLPEPGVHFGFPVTVDAHKGRRAWLVPARGDNQRTAIDGGLFVARTDDGGQSWTQQRKGLPQGNAWDVVYRHALANDAGCVAFGSTTGNLYVSEDGGESWTIVGNNFPPIYSVRFG